MPSLEDQLKEIESKEESFKSVFERFSKFNSALQVVEFLSGVLSLATVFAFFVLLFTYV